MTKIKTPFGYLCLEDDRIAEYAQTTISPMFCEQDLNEFTVSSSEEKMLYRTENPFGKGYTNNYSRVIAANIATMKMSVQNHVREIDFIEIH